MEITMVFDNMLGGTAFLRGWTSDMTHVNYSGAAISSGHKESAVRD